METRDMNDEFLHRIRVRPQSRFASELKMRLDRPATPWERYMSGYIHVNDPISHRSLALFAIVGLHAAFIFALANGLVQRITVSKSMPIVADFPQVERPPEEAPTLPQPKLETWAIPVPEPSVPIDYIPDAPAGSAIDDSPAPVQGGVAAENSGSSFAHAGIGRHFPNPDSFYPAAAIRQEIEGKAIVRVCIGPDGKLAQAPQIARSTGSRLLDEAALQLAHAGTYVAGSRDGVPIVDCFNFLTTFQIKNRR